MVKNHGLLSKIWMVKNMNGQKFMVKIPSFVFCRTRDWTRDQPWHQTVEAVADKTAAIHQHVKRAVGVGAYHHPGQKDRGIVAWEKSEHVSQHGGYHCKKPSQNRQIIGQSWQISRWTYHVEDLFLETRNSKHWATLWLENSKKCCNRPTTLYSWWWWWWW